MTTTSTTPRLTSAAQRFLPVVVAAFGLVSTGCLDFNPVPPTTTTAPTTTTLPPTVEVTQVTAGGAHSCAVDDSGGVRCWGDNAQGALGDGTTTNRSAPVSVGGIVDATAVAAGADHSCALRAAGDVLCWGDETNGKTRVPGSDPLPPLPPSI